MRALRAVMASAMIAGAVAAVTVMAGGSGAVAGALSAHAQAQVHTQSPGSDPIAVVGVTLKTDVAAVVTSRPDGTKQYQLPLSAAVLPYSAAWSPDRKQLALDAAGGVFVIDADGRGFHQVARAETEGTVSWPPEKVRPQKVRERVHLR